MDDFGAYEWMDCVGKAEKDVLTIKEEVGSIINSLSSIRELESCRVADEVFTNGLIRELLASRFRGDHCRENELENCAKMSNKQRIGDSVDKLKNIGEDPNRKTCDTPSRYYDDGRRFMVNDDSFETVSSKDEKVAGVEGIDSHVDIGKEIVSNQFNKATNDSFSAKSDDDSQCNIDSGSSQSVSSKEKRVEKVLDAIGDMLKLDYNFLNVKSPIVVEELNDILAEEQDLITRDEITYRDSLYVWDTVKCEESTVVLNGWCEPPYNIITKKSSHEGFLFFSLDSNFLSSSKKAPFIKLIEYLFDGNNDHREILVATDLVIVRRFHLMSLKANEVVDSRIVNCFAHMLTIHERDRTHNNAKFWWIPTNISRPDKDRLGQYSERSKWDSWVGPLCACDQIYLPIIQDNYWFIAIVKLKENVVHVFDSLQIPTLAIGLAIVDDLLQGLDFIFKKEISLSMPVGWSFKDFIVIKGDHVPLCSKAKESGIYVIKLMQSAYSTEKICENGTEIDERNSIALQLTMSVHNRRRSFLNATIIDSTRF
ncbi:Ulp1 protease family, C-terminal catalytic domain containing protein [Trema orientale]|uniref:Ulp1 protease family, C-terminal catalytic domain containing protein n=1 Tax=Trema orientale TaxID=63057 RepID=A0A2P5FRW4_TREOI|nr:Ulp1 protease family, C-terminal catalytic domain containing protein [Trema orientale]